MAVSFDSRVQVWINGVPSPLSIRTNGGPVSSAKITTLRPGQKLVLVVENDNIADQASLATVSLLVDNGSSWEAINALSFPVPSSGCQGEWLRTHDTRFRRAAIACAAGVMLVELSVGVLSSKTTFNTSRPLPLWGAAPTSCMGYSSAAIGASQAMQSQYIQLSCTTPFIGTFLTRPPPYLVAAHGGSIVLMGWRQATARTLNSIHLRGPVRSGANFTTMTVVAITSAGNGSWRQTTPDFLPVAHLDIPDTAENGLVSLRETMDSPQLVQLSLVLSLGQLADLYLYSCTLVGSGGWFPLHVACTGPVKVGELFPDNFTFAIRHVATTRSEVVLLGSEGRRPGSISLLPLPLCEGDSVPSRAGEGLLCRRCPHGTRKESGGSDTPAGCELCVGDSSSAAGGSMSGGSVLLLGPPGGPFDASCARHATWLNVTLCGPPGATQACARWQPPHDWEDLDHFKVTSFGPEVLKRQLSFDVQLLAGGQIQARVSGLVPGASQWVRFLHVNERKLSLSRLVKVQTQPAIECPRGLRPANAQCNGVGTCDVESGRCLCNGLGEHPTLGLACTVIPGILIQAVAELEVPGYTLKSSAVTGAAARVVARRTGIPATMLESRLLCTLESTGPSQWAASLFIAFSEAEAEACAADLAPGGSSCPAALTKGVQVEQLQRATGQVLGADTVSTRTIASGILDPDTSEASVFGAVGIRSLSMLGGQCAFGGVQAMLPISRDHWKATGFPNDAVLHNLQRCSLASTCSQCLQLAHCGWCSTRSACVQGGPQGPVPTIPTLCERGMLHHHDSPARPTCPVECNVLSGCEACSARPDCAWCEVGRGRCEDLAGRTSNSSTLGVCPSDMRRLAPSQCPASRCSTYTSNSTCLQDQACGWCEMPSVGGAGSRCGAVEGPAFTDGALPCTGVLAVHAAPGVIHACDTAASGCDACASVPGCAWCWNSHTCRPVVSNSASFTSPCEVQTVLPAHLSSMLAIPSVSINSLWGPAAPPRELNASTLTLPQCFPTELACSQARACGTCIGTPGCTWCQVPGAHEGHCMASAVALRSCSGPAQGGAIAYGQQCPLGCAKQGIAITQDQSKQRKFIARFLGNEGEFEIGATAGRADKEVLVPAQMEDCEWQMEVPTQLAQAAAQGFLTYISLNISLPSFISLQAAVNSKPLSTVQGTQSYNCSMRAVRLAEWNSRPNMLSDCGTQHAFVVLSTRTRPGDVVSLSMLHSANSSTLSLPFHGGVAVAFSHRESALAGSQEANLLVSLSTGSVFLVLLLIAFAVWIRRARASSPLGQLRDHQGVPLAVLEAMPLFNLPNLALSGAERAGKEGGEQSCSICFCEFEADDTLRLLPCQHYYHWQCVDKWMVDHTTCPLCRKDVMASGSSGKESPACLPPGAVLVAPDSPRRRARSESSAASRSPVLAAVESPLRILGHNPLRRIQSSAAHGLPAYSIGPPREAADVGRRSVQIQSQV